MRKLSNNLLTLWLAVTLVITPLQAMGTADSGGEPCASHVHTAPDAGTDSHSHQALAGDSAATHCAACCDRGCYQGDDCSSQGCVNVHLQPAAITTVGVPGRQDAHTRVILQPTTLFSRSDPPLLRPPV
jgi:hypothetical protein